MVLTTKKNKIRTVFFLLIIWFDFPTFVPPQCLLKSSCGHEIVGKGHWVTTQRTVSYDIWLETGMVTLFVTFLKVKTLLHIKWSKKNKSSFDIKKLYSGIFIKTSSVSLLQRMASDGHGLKLKFKKSRPTFSTFNALPAQITKIMNKYWTKLSKMSWFVSGEHQIGWGK